MPLSLDHHSVGQMETLFDNDRKASVAVTLDGVAAARLEPGVARTDFSLVFILAMKPQQTGLRTQPALLARSPCSSTALREPPSHAVLAPVCCGFSLRREATPSSLQNCAGLTGFRAHAIIPAYVRPVKIQGTMIFNEGGTRGLFVARRNAICCTFITDPGASCQCGESVAGRL